MSAQVRVRAGIMIAASAVIVSALGYGVSTDAAPADGLRTEAAAATVKKPTATTKKPTATTKKPTATTKKPTTTTKKPTTTTKKPTTTTKPPTSTTQRTAGVTTVATKLTMTAVSTTVTEAQFYRAVLRGTLLNTRTQEPVPDQKVTLYRREAGSTVWTPLVWDRSDARTGKILLAVEQTAEKAEYKMVFAGRPPYLASGSQVVTIKRG